MLTTLPTWHSDPERFVNDLSTWFVCKGRSQYDETVTELDHALQSAALAASETGTDDEIVAALLHDVGHLLMEESHNNFGPDLKHETVGANWLDRFFPRTVTQPIRLHVLAKRYLCAINTEYWSTLSQASQTSLNMQGGPMRFSEVSQFQKTLGYEAAVWLRQFDDEAKVKYLKVPPLAEYVGAIVQTLKV